MAVIVPKKHLAPIDMRLVRRVEPHMASNANRCHMKTTSLLVCSTGACNALNIAKNLAQGNISKGGHNYRIFWLREGEGSESFEAFQYSLEKERWSEERTPSGSLHNKRCFVDILDEKWYHTSSKITVCPQIPVAIQLLDPESAGQALVSIGAPFNEVILNNGRRYAAPLTFEDLARGLDWCGLDCEHQEMWRALPESAGFITLENEIPGETGVCIDFPELRESEERESKQSERQAQANTLAEAQTENGGQSDHSNDCHSVDTSLLICTALRKADDALSIGEKPFLEPGSAFDSSISSQDVTLEQTGDVMPDIILEGVTQPFVQPSLPKTTVVATIYQFEFNECAFTRPMAQEGSYATSKPRNTPLRGLPMFKIAALVFAVSILCIWQVRPSEQILAQVPTPTELIVIVGDEGKGVIEHHNPSEIYENFLKSIWRVISAVKPVTRVQTLLGIILSSWRVTELDSTVAA